MPGNTQNFNRYSYCLNNPLKYTDPSGYLAAPLNEYWNLDKTFNQYTRFHPNWDGMDGGQDGWGGGGGALPGWMPRKEWNGKHDYYYSCGQYYERNSGSVVDFDEVYNNVIVPNSVMITGPSAIDLVYILGNIGPFSLSTNGNDIIVDYKLPSVNNSRASQSHGSLANFNVNNPNLYIRLATFSLLDNYDLTPAEWELIKQNPSIVSDLYENRSTAINYTLKFFPNVQAYNDHADAFRHAYFNALNVQDFGETLTMKLGYAHENFPGNPNLEFRMDIYNNRIGRYYGNFYSLSSDSFLANVIYSATLNGELLMIENNCRLVPTYVP